MSARLRILLHGPLGAPTGFSLINRRLAWGLRARGYQVAACPTDLANARAPAPIVPDVYLFHGYPFDFDNPVGRVNAFFLQWEYRRLPRRWVALLNERFDLVLVPSRPAARVCVASGVRRPVRVCPGGIDPREVHPRRRPARLPTDKRFRFLHLGGAHERRGTDLVLRAYGREFDAADDVCLLLKGFHYRHHRPWLEEAIRAAGLARPGAPALLYRHEFLGSIAPWIAAADVGVFPLRAECLGLPVLECIAGGRPVIVPRGTGLDEFCTAANARFVRARPTRRDGKAQCEPDVSHLQRLMRAAYERGPLSRREREAVARTVRHRTWKRAQDRLAAALGEAWRARARGRARRAGAGRVVGTAGHCLERFRDARDGAPGVVCVRAGAAAPLERVLMLANAERARARVDPLRRAPIDRFRDAAELRLAHRVVVDSRAARRAFRAAGWPDDRIDYVPPRLRPGPRRAPPARPVRYLFIAADPFLGGLRVLLAAWAKAGLRDAELVCVCAPAAWRSPRLLRALLRQPEICTHARLGPRAVARELDRAHYLVEPALLAGISATTAAALGRGRPLLAGAATGAAELVTPGVNGYRFRSGSAAALAEVLRRSRANHARWPALSLAAWRTAGGGPAAWREREAG